MAEDVLNSLGTGFQFNEVRSTAMTEHVRCDALFDCMNSTDAVVQGLHLVERNELCPRKNDFASRFTNLTEGETGVPDVGEVASIVRDEPAFLPGWEPSDRFRPCP